jgi:fumarate hydratase, class I
MTVIRQEDFIASVAGALQYISYYHPVDYITSLAKAYEREQSPAAKDAMAQILINSRMCAEGHRPICQDTGIVNAFVKGRHGRALRARARRRSRWTCSRWSTRACAAPISIPTTSCAPRSRPTPRASASTPKTTRPPWSTSSWCKGDTVEVTVAAKGGGSEAKSKFAMLNPSDSVVEWVLKTVPTMGAGWCPPGMLGIGIGGTAEKAMLLAKQSLMDPIDIQDLIARGRKTTAEKLRVELYDKVNRLGIGAQGLGGLTTVLDVKVLDTPAHAANLPVAMIPNCAATRHAHIVLDGSGPVYLDPPRSKTGRSSPTTFPARAA